MAKPTAVPTAVVPTTAVPTTAVEENLVQEEMTSWKEESSTDELPMRSYQRNKSAKAGNRPADLCRVTTPARIISSSAPEQVEQGKEFAIAVQVKD